MGRRALRQLPGQRVVEGEPQRVDVRARIAAPPREHLRRGVRQGAGQRAAPGDPQLAVELGRPEVGEPGASVGIEQDVLRLDVAMQDAVAVGRGERAGHVAAEADGGVSVEPAALRDPDLQVGAANVFHDDEAPRPVLQEVEHRDDVGVGEAAHRLHLPPHPLARHLRRGRRRHQQLEGHVGVELPVAGQVHDRVAAAAELAPDLVAVPEQGARRQVAGRGHFAASSRRSTSSALLRQPSSLR